MEQTQNMDEYYEDSEDNEQNPQWSFRTNAKLLPNAPEGLSTSFNSDHPATRLRRTTSRASTQHRPLSRNKTDIGMVGGLFKRYYDENSINLTRQSQDRQ